MVDVERVGQIEDRIQIGEQLARYAYTWDRKDAEGFAMLFSETGVLERWADGERIDASVVRGRSNIAAYARAAHQGRLANRQSRHHLSGLIFLELIGDSAVTQNMALITHQKVGELPQITATGVYRIAWCRINGDWRINQRVLYSDSGPAPPVGL